MNRLFLILALLVSLGAQAQIFDRVPATQPTATDGAAITETISLTWSIPTTRENGDLLPVTEISGYEILAKYPDGETQTIPVLGGAVKSHSMPLTHGSGVYDFAIRSIDTDSIKSALSDNVTMTASQRSKPSKMESLRVKIVCQAGSTCNFYEAD